MLNTKWGGSQRVALSLFFSLKKAIIPFSHAGKFSLSSKEENLHYNGGGVAVQHSNDVVCHIWLDYSGLSNTQLSGLPEYEAARESQSDFIIKCLCVRLTRMRLCAVQWIHHWIELLRVFFMCALFQVTHVHVCAVGNFIYVSSCQCVSGLCVHFLSVWQTMSQFRMWKGEKKNSINVMMKTNHRHIAR